MAAAEAEAKDTPKEHEESVGSTSSMLWQQFQVQCRHPTPLLRVALHCCVQASATLARCLVQYLEFDIL